MFDAMVGRIEKHLRSLRYIDRYSPQVDFLIEYGMLMPHWHSLIHFETAERNLRNSEESIPINDRVVFTSANISSPGFWEFLAKLNPLEIIRLFLNDRHERRKDRQYREGMEEENLYLQNELLRNKIIRERWN